VEESDQSKSRNRWNISKKFLFVASTLILIAMLGLTLLVDHQKSDQSVVSPVPQNLTTSVSFPIYYPDPQKLPAGYSLDKTSFTSPTKNVVLYTVNYGQNKKLIFSLQPRPSDNDLKNFNTQRIPIHIEFQSNLGNAELGIIGNQAIVSLPTNDNLWIIVTGPQNLTEKQVAPVLNDLIK
jgi:hypothetical protein